MQVHKHPRQTKQHLDHLASAYLDAKEAVIEAGYADEIDWQAETRLASASESTFLREAAWVVLSSGFSEAVVRRIFPGVSSAFFDWQSGALIVSREDECRESALRVFGNYRKITAIAAIAKRVADQGIELIRQRIRTNGIEYLREFPFIGPVTAYHLAKNLGVPTAKPDRHLVRTSKSVGYRCPHDLCLAISEYIAEPIAVVDLVLWRFYALNSASPFPSPCVRE
jgi:hypothetical protein